MGPLLVQPSEDSPLLQKGAAPVEAFHRLEIVTEKRGAEPQSHIFLVGQARGGGDIAKKAAQAAEAFGVPVVPFAGVAAPLSAQGGYLVENAVAVMGKA